MMSFRFLQTLLVGVLLAASTATAVAAEPAAFESHTTLGERPATGARGMQPFARLEIGRGSELMFYELADDRGRSGGVGIAQYIPVGGKDPATVAKLRHANPLELYHAFSHFGTATPSVLQEYEGNRFVHLDQGWALDQVDQPVTYDEVVTCENTEQDFADEVQAVYETLPDAGGLGPHKFVDLSMSPSLDPYSRFESVPPGHRYVWDVPLGLLSPSAHLQNLYVQVMLCEEDYMYPDDSVNVELAYEVFEPDDEGEEYVKTFSSMVKWHLDSPGDQMRFTSWPPRSVFDERILRWSFRIEDVRYYDVLHVGRTATCVSPWCN